MTDELAVGADERKAQDKTLTRMLRNKLGIA